MSPAHDNWTILLIGPIPPPYGGQSVLVESILESKISEKINLTVLNIAHEKPGFIKRAILSAVFLVRLICILVTVNGLKLLHIHTSAGPAFWEKSLFVIAGKLFGKKVILHLHGGRLVSFWNEAGNFKKFIIRKILNCCDAVIVLSTGGRSFVEMEISSSARILVLPNAVESVTGQVVSSPDNVTFLYVGHLKPEKGLLDLLHAFRECRNLTNRAIRLKIMGGGDTEENETIIKNAYTAAGLDEVSFVGVLTGADKWREFFSSDVFVLPSHSEDMPMTILEAMACGLPVIATSVGSIPDVIENGINGYLVTSHNPSYLAEKMALLAEHSDIRQAMSMANRQKVREDYSFDRFQNDLEKVYLDALAK
jgi:glycosyltransferase involved in cell wall biosynthesis